MTATSVAALISITHIRGKLKRRVFGALQEHGRRGATCDELEHMLSMRHQSLSARVRELYQEGWISKLAKTRSTRSGRQASVYRVREHRKIRKPRSRCECCGQVLLC